MINALLEALAVGTLTVAFVYATSYAIAYPIMKYREAKWKREDMNRLRIYMQNNKELVL